MPRPVFVCFIALVCALLAAAPAFTVEWPADSFQAVARQPTPEEVSRFPEEISVLDQAIGFAAGKENLQTGATLEATGWFTEIGGYYRRASHKPPALEPIIQDGSVSKYRVYIFPFSWSRTRWFSDAGGTFENNKCGASDKVSWLAINHNPASGPMPRSNYWTIGHELMHSLMAGDNILANCNSNPFEVSEGIPEGASLYLINRKYKNFSGRIDTSSSAVGLRSYKLPLFYFKDVETNKKSRLELKTGYLTGSFWRFIAERFGGLRVFPLFLESPIIKGASQQWMYRWLDERLGKLDQLEPKKEPVEGEKKKQAPSLHEVYPAFVTEFASYGGARYMGFAGRTWSSWQQARDVWLNQAFGGCRRVTLEPGWRETAVTMDINKNAAACLRVRFKGFKGNIRSQMEVLGDSVAKTDQLHLGWAWKIGLGKTENCFKKRRELNSKWPPCVYKAFTQTGPQVENYARTWPLTDMDFGQQENGIIEWIYVLSNVAVKPWNTVEARNLVVRVAVSDGEANGEPVEPIHQLPLARTGKTAPNPSKPIGREELYGLQTNPPAPETGIKGFSLIPYRATSGNGVRVKVKGGYSVQLNRMEYGKTGPVTGVVVIQPGDPRTRNAVISSALCKHGAQAIGQVIRSDEDAVQIKVDADLCKAAPSTRTQCDGGCPVVDHVSAQINVAYGWRQFGQSAPTDIRTPGIQRYINTMPDSLEQAMNFGANTALPDYDGLPQGSSGRQSSGAGAKAGAGGSLAPCACTCEELWATEERGLELKAQIEAGAETSTAALGSLSRCVTPCQREYMICRFEADEAEKEKEKAAKEKAADPQSCDCSCSALAEVNTRGEQMRKQFEAGVQVDMQALQDLMRCMPACQQQQMDCMLQQQ